MTDDKWTKEEYETYEHYLKRINDSYGQLPAGRAESVAADIVNRLRNISPGG